MRYDILHEVMRIVNCFIKYIFLKDLEMLNGLRQCYVMRYPI